ncbi:MAG: hypothetical protein Q7N50_15870, partial [Armatimonadota bacterium]|nr:hypothetical protein [Armatimonadota bacterium]
MPVNIFAAGHGVCGRMRAVLLVTAILILCSAPVIAAQRITQVQVANLDGKVQIAVAATEPITVNVKQSQVGKFLAFDIRGYYSPVRSGKVSIASGKIYNVRYGRFRTNPHVARIALATRGKLTYTTRFIKDRTSMIIDVWKAGKSMAKQSPKPHLALAMAPAVRSIPLVTRTPSPQTVVRATDTRIAQPVVIRPVEVDEQPTEIKPVLVAAAPTSPARIIRRAGQPVEDTVSPSPQRNISLDFVSAEINDVLKALSVQSGANIVSGADVKGQITVSLNRASLEQALDYVAKLSGYKYAKAGQETYLVGNNVGAAMVSGSDTVVTEAITLRLVTPDDALVKMLNAMWPNVKIAFPKPNEAKETEDTGNVGPGHLKVIAGKAYKLTPPKPLSTVLLNGPSGEVVMVKEAIQKMEDSLGQRSDGSITQVYRVKSGNVTQLIKLVNQVVPVVSVSWATDAFKLEGGDLGNQPDYIVLTGPEQQVNEAIELLNQVDTKPSQILIEAKVVDVMNDALRDIGVDWSWSTFSSRGSVDISNVKSNPTELPETA